MTCLWQFFFFPSFLFIYLFLLSNIWQLFQQPCKVYLIIFKSNWLMWDSTVAPLWTWEKLSSSPTVVMAYRQKRSVVPSHFSIYLGVCFQGKRREEFTTQLAGGVAPLGQCHDYDKIDWSIFLYHSFKSETAWDEWCF